ncbi:MAG: hypothetical protein ACQESC_02835 [Nanobdellota archaeon]
MKLQEYYGKKSIGYFVLDNDFKIISDLLEQSLSLNINIKSLKQRQILLKKAILRNELSIKKSSTKILSVLRKKNTPHPRLEDIELLAQIIRDCNQDPVFLKIKQLLKKEKEIISSITNKTKSIKQKETINILTTVLKQEKRIFNQLKTIFKETYSETHIHFGMSSTPKIFWNELKHLWRLSIAGRVKKEHDIRKQYDKYLKQNKITKKGYNKLHSIMKKYFSRSITESEAFYQFQQVIPISLKEKGSFKRFNNKATLLTPIPEISDRINHKRINTLILEDIVRFMYSLGVRIIEIRFPFWEKNHLELFGIIARELEKKYNNKITIRYIIFAIGEVDSQKNICNMIEHYCSLTTWKKKYFVGVDDLKFRIKKLDSDKGISIPQKWKTAIHAGEFFFKGEPGFNSNKIENITKALDQIQNALQTTRIHRIGHGSILAFDISSHLKKYSWQKVKPLVIKQQQLIQEIKKRKIIIETNPTSNVYISNFGSFKKHPIAFFEEKNILFSISTDDKLIFDTNIRKEYARIAVSFDWDETDIHNTAKTSKKSSF